MSNPWPARTRPLAGGWAKTVMDEITVSLPADLPPGEYHLLVGLYRWDTLERLPVIDDYRR